MHTQSQTSADFRPASLIVTNIAYAADPTMTGYCIPTVTVDLNYVSGEYPRQLILEVFNSAGVKVSAGSNLTPQLGSNDISALLPLQAGNSHTFVVKLEYDIRLDTSYTKVDTPSCP